MWNLNQRLSERLTILEFKSGTMSSTPLLSTAVKIGTHKRVMGIFVVNGLATDAESLDFHIFKATDSAGTGAAILKAATQRAAHATANDNIMVIINLMQEEIDDAKPYIGLKALTSAGTGNSVTMILLGADCRYDPAEYNVAAARLVETVD